jgi:hypothetical protein
MAHTDTTCGVFTEQLPTPNRQDYSEEAIPERDPAYCLPVGTCYDESTIEVLSKEQRLEFVRQLQQLGMSYNRAFVLAIL